VIVARLYALAALVNYEKKPCDRIDRVGEKTFRTSAIAV
jgi:hypothetical protein